jgi:hypothetical protein
MAADSSSSEVTSDKSKVKLENLGSEDHLDRKPKLSPFETSSSKIITSSSSENPSGSASSSSFIANETLSESSEEANEIRKRRLQKFLQSN